MTKIKSLFLISCGSQKRKTRSPARDLYTFHRFVKARSLAELTNSPWFILSAKHKLLHPDRLIDPYDETLKDSGDEIWAEQVCRQMERELPKVDKVIILASKKYYKYLVPWLESQYPEVSIPMAKINLFYQPRWLAYERRSDLDNFYGLLERLENRIGGRRLLSDCNGQMDWPKRGVYFFFEPNECRHTGKLQRVVRVGAHALISKSKTTLWNRLSQHRGTINPYGGNHRGSIFRLLVGNAMMRRNPDLTIESWGRGSSAPRNVRLNEQEHEARVSDYLGSMTLLFLPVSDEPGRNSIRGIIERNSIALLSNYLVSTADKPSMDWLGESSSRNRVRQSGLWNNEHVDEIYDPKFLSLFEDMIEQI